MNAKELIRAKRDGASLDPEDLRAIAQGIADGGFSDAQVAAFAMAVFFRGLDATELPAFTLGMRDSGTVLDWSGLDRPVLDKHSTGGVGDKVSLLLAPIIAACGGAVPMLSGRGLGHTGGTLDKLEAIPGYDTAPDNARLRAVVEETGCAIVGQTDDLAPADRRLYATRDATGSVESIPLIVSSILSKKLAAGLGSLVLDVKHGSGAFMAELDDARDLARALVDVAVAAGLPTVALLTDMDSALGVAAGNALEVRECIDVLTGHGDPDERLVEVTLALCDVLLDLGGLRRRPRRGAAQRRRGRALRRDGGRARRTRRPARAPGRAPARRAGDARGRAPTCRLRDIARDARPRSDRPRPRRRPPPRGASHRSRRRPRRDRRARGGGRPRRAPAGGRPRAGCDIRRGGGRSGARGDRGRR